MSRLNQLTYLDLREAEISQWPTGTWELPGLLTLHLEDNFISNIPEQVLTDTRLALTWAAPSAARGTFQALITNSTNGWTKYPPASTSSASCCGSVYASMKRRARMTHSRSFET